MATNASAGNSVLRAEPPTRLELPERLAQIPGDLRELHRAILREFTRSGAPVRQGDLRRVAEDLGLDADAAFGALAQADLVYVDSAGTIVVAYPFSGRDLGISVTLAGGPMCWAMCAIDALGIPQMTGRAAVIAAVDPHDQEPVRVEVRDGKWSWLPPEAVVLVAASECAGSTAERICPLITFHVDERSAQAHLAAQPGATGKVVARPRAIEIAGELFAAVLAPA